MWSTNMHIVVAIQRLDGPLDFAFLAAVVGYIALHPLVTYFWLLQYYTGTLIMHSNE